MRARSVGSLVLLNAYWIPLNFQTTALMTIAVPLAVLRFPVDHVAELAALATVVALISMIVPPLAGEISDRLHRRGTSRAWLIVGGALVNAAGLLWMIHAPAAWIFGAAVAVATVGQNVSQAAYSALIPEAVPREQWGAASGYQGVGTLLGAIGGLVVAGAAGTSGVVATLLASSALIVVGSLTVLGRKDETFVETGHAEVKDLRNFALVFASRFFTIFGLTLLNTFILYFFQDVLKVTNAPAGTAYVGVATMLGAIATSIAMGTISDRTPRKFVVALAGVPMALAAIGFGVMPQVSWILVFAVCFGLGYGAFLSTGWALAIDSVPELGSVARYLGIWGIASNLPAIFAPEVGHAILKTFAADLQGYPALFVASGASFLIGSVVVLGTGRRGERPRLPAAAGPLQAFAMAVIHPWYLSAYRIRWWGRLPRRRGATLAICNHQHDLDTTCVIMRLSVGGPWMQPIYAVASRRLFEPGFMSSRRPWLEPLLRRVNFGLLFRAIGMLPLENEPRRRPVAAFAHEVDDAHGDVGVGAVFDDDVLEKLSVSDPRLSLHALFGLPYYHPARDLYVSLATVREPYRSEIVARLRRTIDEDLARIEQVLRAGGTLYLTPEGKYTRDGRLGRFKAAMERLAALGTVYVLCVSYDPFVGPKLSMLFRVLPAPDPGDLRSSLAAPRPVVVSQLVAAYLRSSPTPFDEGALAAAVTAALARLPAGAFVDPELRDDPRGMTKRALDGLAQLGILATDGAAYRLTQQRKHPQFPDVPDIVAHQANMLEETAAGCERLAARA